MASLSDRQASEPRKFFPVHPRPGGGVAHRQGVTVREHCERLNVRSRGTLLQVPVQEQVEPPQEAPKIGCQGVLHECLDRLRAGVLLEVDAVPVVPVAALPVLPRHRRVVAELVEPRADERVAALDLVVEEAERQVAVHRLNPERQPAELHRQRIEVHGVDAPLHHVAAQHGAEARLEIVLLGLQGISSSAMLSLSGSASARIPSSRTRVRSPSARRRP